MTALGLGDRNNPTTVIARRRWGPHGALRRGVPRLPRPGDPVLRVLWFIATEPSPHRQAHPNQVQNENCW